MKNIKDDWRFLICITFIGLPLMFIAHIRVVPIIEYIVTITGSLVIATEVYKKWVLKKN